MDRTALGPLEADGWERFDRVQSAPRPARISQVAHRVFWLTYNTFVISLTIDIDALEELNGPRLRQDVHRR